MRFNIFVKDDLLDCCSQIFYGDNSLIVGLEVGDYLLTLKNSRLYQVSQTLQYFEDDPIPYIRVKEMNIGNCRYKKVLVI